MYSPPIPGRVRQIRALTHAFVARFFENELTSGTNDLRSSFYWLVALLAPVGVFMPWVMVFSYTAIYYEGGHALLRLLSQADKTMYLGYGMVTTGAVAVVVWNSMLIDRRDALVIGVLPVRGSTMVAAKLVALVGYVGLIAVGTHAAGAFSFGFVLGNWGGFEFAFRSIPAHFLAACLASAFVLFSVAGVQGLLLAMTGPRVFARVSPILQLALAALVLISFFMLPTIAGSVVDTLGTRPEHFGITLEQARHLPNHPWILSTPPLWFLGIYEQLLGDPILPAMPSLALKAWLALGISLGVVVLTYPLAYRRLGPSAVEGVSARRRSSAHLAASEWLARHLARGAGARASLQFFLATMARVERHRFVLAVTGGLLLVAGLPSALAVTRGLGSTSLPRLELLSAPMAVMTLLLVGLRTAASLPSEPKAGWIFSLMDPLSGPSRAGVARACWLFGVLPTLIVFVPLLWWALGPSMALVHSVLITATGALVIEALLMGLSAVPCTQPWRPEGMNLRLLWPLYLAAFAFLTRVIPVVTWFSRGNWLPPALFAFGMTTLAVALHIRARRVVRATYPETDLPPPVQVLDI